jgi:tetratricopeptide (TPR) repeat protein
MRCNSVYGYCCAGNWRAAIETAREAQTLCTDGNVYKKADVLCCLVYMYSQMGDDEKAEHYRVEMEGYLPFVRKDAQPLDATGALAESRSGNAAEAVVRLQRAVEMLEGAQFAPLVLHTKCWLGEAYMHASRYDRARITLQEVLSLARQCGSPFFEGWVLRLLGETALLSGGENAKEYFQRAIDIFTAHGCRHDLALSLEGSAQAALREGHTEEAKSCFAEALNIFEQIGTLGKPDEIRAALSTL